VVAVAVESRGRDEAGQTVEKLEGGQAERGAAVSGGTRQMVDEAGVGGAQGPIRRDVAQPVQSKRGSGTISETRRPGDWTPGDHGPDGLHLRHPPRGPADPRPLGLRGGAVPPRPHLRGGDPAPAAAGRVRGARSEVLRTGPLRHDGHGRTDPRGGVDATQRGESTRRSVGHGVLRPRVVAQVEPPACELPSPMSGGKTDGRSRQSG